MAGFQEYPKKLIHKDHADVVFKPLTEEQQKLKGLFAPVPELVSPERYPSVTVSNLKQEQEYASKGYRPANNANAAEYEQAILDQKPCEGYAFNAYPKYKYHAINVPVVVKDAKEEAALGEGWEDSPVIATEDDIPKITKPKVAKVAKPKVAKKAKSKAKSKAVKSTKAVAPGAPPAA